MSKKRHLVKLIKKNLPKFSRSFISAIKRKLVWLLRTLFLSHQRRGNANAGFVLPTVALVSVVVVLTTTAIAIRSFDRAQNASNVRVNQAVLTAAMPAIDRGRAKIDRLFRDTTLPRVTPTDDQLYDALTADINQYTFGDETPITLTEGSEELQTAWRFPVDTDNNGKFDSFTLYGIYFRNPPVGSNNQYERARNTLEARTPPMQANRVDAQCATNPTLIGDTGWVRQNNEFVKSFFVYTATVPITEPPSDDDNFEEYTGNKSFAAVEYQQDRIQQPNNYAVLYNDDLRIDTESNFNNKLNGSVFTNSNILNSSDAAQMRMYQVSARGSCLYKPINAKISVGGNVSLDKAAQTDLFRGKSTNVTTTNLLNSVTNDADDTAYNNLAYEERIQALVNEQMGKNVNTDPTEVKNGIKRRKEDLGLPNNFTGDDEKLRREQLEFYFRKRTRRVPFAEVATIPSTVTQGTGDTLRPIDRWMYPIGNDNLTLNINSGSLEPKATEPEELQKQGGREELLGDRVLVGNNLPEIWWDAAKQRFVGPGIDDTQEISGVKWNKPADNNDTRTRRSRVKTFDDNIAFTERDGQWEVKAANEGGLRIVTGAGIYTNANGSLNIDPDIPIWPDTKPVPGSPPPIKTSIKPYWLYAGLNEILGINSPNQLGYEEIEYVWENLTDTNKPRLRMRATAVYGLPPNPTQPICVSSYYVPTDSTTAKNRSTLPNTATNTDGTFIVPKDTNGLSNNGIVYGQLTLNNESQLEKQADLKYPNGRSVDDGLLKRALDKAAADRTFAEQSAIDAQLCALQILNSPGSFSSSPAILHGAIREIAFLDPREVEDNGSASTPQQYNKDIKDRKPLEIRATVLNLGVLRPKLPKSGLIYATRNDALPDRSDTTVNTGAKISPVDYKLDPTRRPNGIMLENGAQLWGATYDPEEKGFVLATNLPAYIKGDFNLHSTGEEFTEALTNDWSNFYTRSTINQNFACRNGDPTKTGCNTSDTWRPAAVLADAVTVLSKDFKEGVRDEGDYDWTLAPAIKQELASGKTLPPGFSEYNNFVNFQKWYITKDDDPTGELGQPKYFSSYLNNFVTPINMRAQQGSYLTEACIIPDGQTKEEACGDPFNWIMLISNSCTASGGQDKQYIHDKHVNSPYGVSGNTNANRMKTGFGFEDPDEWGQSGGCFAGTNVVRRLAFLRNKSDGTLATPLKVLASAGQDGGTGTIQIFEFGSDRSLNNQPLQDIPNADDQTIPWLDPNTLVPVLQIVHPFASFENPNNPAPVTSGNNGNWLQPASDTTTVNAVIITRDSPANATEKNGGLLNLVRYMENWNAVNKISGTLGQVKKSVYATAPFTAVNSSEKYAMALDDGERTGYIPPSRNWRYDVALLTQKPDFLSEQLPTLPSNQLPEEYFREVSRSDRWVETLLCGKESGDNGPFAIPDPKQRPAKCPS